MGHLPSTVTSTVTYVEGPPSRMGAQGHSLQAGGRNCFLPERKQAGGRLRTSLGQATGAAWVLGSAALGVLGGLGKK